MREPVAPSSTNAPVAPVRVEPAAARVEAERLAVRDVAFGPEDVRGGQRRVAAEIDLDRGREPAQAEAVLVAHEERGLREVHLRGHRLHPALGARRGQHAHGGRVAGERTIGERVDLADRVGHASNLTHGRWQIVCRRQWSWRS